VVVMFAVYLIAYVASGFLIGMGPLFIACYFFPFARQWFDGWLSCLMAAVFSQIFSVALGAMFNFTLTMILDLAASGLKGSQAGQVDGGIVVGEIMMLFVTAMVCIIFAILAGSLVLIAARIAGGVHAELGRLQAPTWMRGGGPTDAPGAIPGGGVAAPAPASPGPQYPFNHTVGSAP
jgi:hypothetical protein